MAWLLGTMDGPAIYFDSSYLRHTRYRRAACCSARAARWCGGGSGGNGPSRPRGGGARSSSRWVSERALASITIAATNASSQPARQWPYVTGTQNRQGTVRGACCDSSRPGLPLVTRVSCVCFVRAYVRMRVHAEGAVGCSVNKTPHGCGCGRTLLSLHPAVNTRTLL